MKQTKVPVILLLIAGIAYGAAKGYVYYQTKSTMDNAVAQAALFATITYQGISSDLLKGEVSVNGLAVTPVTLQDSITIRQVSIQGDGPMFLFRDAANMAQKTPQFMQFAVRGVEADIGGELMNSFAAMSAAAKVPGRPANSCEFGGVMQAADLQALGIQTLTADLLLQVSNDKLSGKTKLKAEFELEEIGSVEFDASVKGSATPAGMMMAPSADQVRFAWTVVPGHMNRVNAYCAEKLNKQPVDYIEYLADAPDEDYLKFYGFIPGKAIREAIKTFMVKPGTFEIRMLPAADMNPATLANYSTKDIIEMLGLHLYVNEKEIKPLEFSLAHDSKAGLAEKATDKAGKDAQAQEQSKATYTYQLTPVARLPQYIGAQVRVLQTDGLQREGTLISLKREEAQIEQRMHGGKYAVFVPVLNIKKVEVLRLLKQAK